MSVFWTDEHVALQLSVADIPKIVEGLKGLLGPGMGAPDQAARISKLWEDIKEMLLRISKLEERLDRLEAGKAGREEGDLGEEGDFTEYGRNLGLENKKP